MHGAAAKLIFSFVTGFSAVGCSFVISTDGLSGGEASSSSPEIREPAGGGSCSPPPSSSPTTKGCGRPTTPLSADGGAATSLPDSQSGDGGPPINTTNSNNGICAPGSTGRLLCDDFDNPAALLMGWKTEGNVFINTEKAFSPTSSLLTTTGSAQTDSTASEINRDLPPSAGDRPLRASWVMLNETVSSTCNGANTGSLYFTDGAKYFIIQVQIRKDNALAFQEYGAPGEGGSPDYSIPAPVSSPTPSGQWVRVSMTIDRKASNGPTVNVNVNGQPALVNFKTKGGAAGGLGPLTKVMYAVGLTYVASPSGPCRVRFDDVMLETF